MAKGRFIVIRTENKDILKTLIEVLKRIPYLAQVTDSWEQWETGVSPMVEDPSELAAVFCDPAERD